MKRDGLRAFLTEALGRPPGRFDLYERALTHSSIQSDNYERLEFLGDRVLGLVVARLLFDRFPKEPEGKLSRRSNVLVSRETCGEIGRELGLPEWIRLGRQARDDGAAMGDNIVGDVVEALIGALYLDGGIEASEAFIRKEWTPRLESQSVAPKHPKSALQELAAARGLPAPEYALVERSGAHHEPHFRLRVTIEGAGEAEGEGSSKQEAETAAAAAMLERMQ